MSKFIASYLQDESGAAAAEYALILAIVCTGIAGAVLLLGSNVSSAISTAATKV